MSYDWVSAPLPFHPFFPHTLSPLLLPRAQPHRFYRIDRSWNNMRRNNGHEYNADQIPGVCLDHFAGAGMVRGATGGPCTLFALSRLFALVARLQDPNGPGPRGGLILYWRDHRRIAPKGAKRNVRPSGAPVTPWAWENGSWMSLGPLREQKI